MELSRQDVSDLFRWLVREGRIGDHEGIGQLCDGEIDEICSLISDSDWPYWQEQWKQFQESTQPKLGIGMHSRLQG